MFKFSKNSIAKLEGEHPKLVELCLEVIKESPVDFAIVQGMRTQRYQDELYTQGRTTAQVRAAGIKDLEGQPNKMVVTWTRDSKHIPDISGYAKAIDFAAYVDGKISWEPSYYKPIANTFKSVAKRMGLKIECGADWTRADWGHVQIHI